MKKIKNISTTEITKPAPLDESRRKMLMDAALTVFTRYGYRKTSMEEVAKAAQISRQGLYLYFTTKEILFREMVDYVLQRSLHTVAAIFSNPSLSLEQSLVRTFDEWIGQYLDMIGVDMFDLIETTNVLIGPLVAQHDELVIEQIAEAIGKSDLMTAYESSELTAHQLADTLYATAHGLKYRNPSRAVFLQGMTIAIRVMCMPLRKTL